ncbi:hypothetical protein BJX62DRAFT_241003 [Aspergillus germanicus]
MDPLTAISLASSIIAIVDFSFKVLSGAQEIYESGKGSTAENQSLETIIHEMQQLNANLILLNTSSLQGNQRQEITLFLESENVKPTMDQYLKDFSPQDAISQLFLAAVKANKTCGVRDLSNDLHNIMRLRIVAGMDQKPPFAFCESFHLEFLRRGMKEWPPEDATEITLLGHWFAHLEKPRRSTSLDSAHFLSMSEINPQHRLEKQFHVSSPFFQSAYLGHGEDVRWKVLSDPLILNTKGKCGFLMSLIAHGWSLGAICVAEHLIDRLHPQTIIHSGWANLFEPGPSPKEGWTFWQGFIRRIFFADKAQSKLMDRNLVGQLIQLFLVKGADTRLSIAKTSIIIEATDDFDDPRDAQGFCSVTLEKTIVEGRISLRDLVDYWMPDNRDTIFAMLESVENGIYKNESSPRQESPGVTNSTAIARRNGSKTWLEIARNTAIVLLGVLLGFMAATFRKGGTFPVLSIKECMF